MNRPRPCWAPTGIRPEVASQLIREYIYLYGAVSPRDGTCVYLIMPTSNTACFQAFIDVLSRRFRREDILLVLDGAPNHRCAELVQQISCFFFCRRIPRSSIQRKICGMKSARKSSRTMPSNRSTTCATSSSRQSYISSAIQQSSNQSRPFLTSKSHSDVEMVSEPINKEGSAGMPCLFDL